jgi:hypothetical protein
MSRWTTEKPARVGWFWHREGPGEFASPCYVTLFHMSENDDSEDEYQVELFGISEQFVADVDGEWAPCVPPGDET